MYRLKTVITRTYYISPAMPYCKHTTMKLQLVLLVCTFALICADKPAEKICNVFCPEPPTPEECLAQNLAYVPKIGTLNCCVKCEKASDVIRPGCKPRRCEEEKCVGDKIEDCKPGQVLVPRDGRCYCCPKCVDYWAKPDCPHKKE